MQHIAAFPYLHDPDEAVPTDQDVLMANAQQFVAETPAGDGDKIDGLANDVDDTMLEEDAAIKEVPTPIFASYDGANDDNEAQKKSRKAPSRATVRPAKRPKTDAWSVENLIQSPKSKLLKTNMKAMLKDDQAWTPLDDKAQEKIISRLPQSRLSSLVTTVDGKQTLNVSLLMSNSSWNYFIGCVRDDISLGRNKPAWLQDANTAYLERQVGKFDTWKEKEYEEFWGVKQKLAAGVIAGSSATLKWDDLVKRGLFKEGDVFQYSRRVAGVEVKKDVELMELVINEKTGHISMICRFASGTRVIPKGTDEDIIRDDVAGPESLGRTAIGIHGGLTGQRLPNGNAWKVIRLMRKNQDLGTVWDVRQAVHFSDAEKRLPTVKSGKNGKKAKKEVESDEDDEAYVAKPSKSKGTRSRALKC